MQSVTVNVKGVKYKVSVGDVFHYYKINRLYRDKNKNSKIYVNCTCICGNSKDVLLYSILGGNTKSCGCYNSRLTKERNTKHSLASREKRDRLYNIWLDMRKRCYTQTSKSYVNYGGRGIKVCDEWDDYLSFRSWALNNKYNDKLSLDRINVNGNYEPDNCRWADNYTQARNKRNSHFLNYNGKCLTISEWSRELGISRGTILQRLTKGKPLKDVLKN